MLSVAGKWPKVIKLGAAPVTVSIHAHSFTRSPEPMPSWTYVSQGLSKVSQPEAGDAPLEVNDDIVNGIIPCVEIMTGAAFPFGRTSKLHFDACIPWEHAMSVPECPGAGEDERLIQISCPVGHNQHRRLAGSDHCEGDLIVKEGSIIDTRHVMAVASVGIESLRVLRTVQVGVLSTGSELFSNSSCRADPLRKTIPDVNGPYLTSAIRELGAEVSFLGSVRDDVGEMTDHLRCALSSKSYDIIVASGAVSAGKLDYIPKVIADLMGSIHFHHVAIRPGHPVLFASLSNIRESGEIRPQIEKTHANGKEHGGSNTTALHESHVAFFGLPGNPIAAAACLRFLFVPYFRNLLGISDEPGVQAKVVPRLSHSHSTAREAKSSDLVFSNPRRLDQFRHGQLRIEGNGAFVELSMQQSPAKIRPFAVANCWVHIPREVSEVHTGNVLQTYPLCSLGLAC